MSVIRKLQDSVDKNGVYDWGTVTVGNRTEPLDMIGYNSATIQYTVSDIGTNVVTGVEISNDAIGYDNADANDTWETKTANGTYVFSYNGSAKYLRFYWVSASGGSPKITDILIYGGQL